MIHIFPTNIEIRLHINVRVYDDFSFFLLVDVINTWTKLFADEHTRNLDLVSVIARARKNGCAKRTFFENILIVGGITGIYIVIDYRTCSRAFSTREEY